MPVPPRSPGAARAFLDLAARLALRAVGDTDPNPAVGCVIVDANGEVIGLGHHRKYGGPHAEREALADCRRRGHDPRGATVFVTLEPCGAHGKQPPCTDALLEARVSGVVAARRDPSPLKGGGAAVLADAGVEIEFTGESPLATGLSDPFVHRVRTGLPWVIAKWAQQPGGEMRFAADGSRWISGEAARRRVHRLRARVDAIVTGIGTVRADDPLLTARHVARVRRVARRVVVARDGRLPPGSILARTARDVPVSVTTLDDGGAERATAEGVEVLPIVAGSGGVDLRAMLLELAVRHGTGTVLLEAGPGLLDGFAHEGLIDEAVVYVAGSQSVGPDRPRLQGPVAARLNDTTRWRLCRARPVGADAEFTFRRIRG